MNIVCLDLEGVLVPEIWIAFAEASGIPELKRTTRDEPDYDKLMNWRLGILKEHGLGLKEIQATIEKIDPIPGAKDFLDELRSLTQVMRASLEAVGENPFPCLLRFPESIHNSWLKIPFFCPQSQQHLSLCPAPLTSASDLSL